MWLLDDQQVLRKKGRGQLLHVSDFVIESHGRLRLPPAMLAKQLELPEEERLTVTDA